MFQLQRKRIYNIKLPKNKKVSTIIDIFNIDDIESIE